MHDEIIIECDIDEKEVVSSLAENIMKSTAIPEMKTLDINVKVSKDICNWWDECTEEEFIASLNKDLDLISLVNDDIC